MNEDLLLKLEKQSATIDMLTMAFISIIATEHKQSRQDMIAISLDSLKEKLIAHKLASSDASDAYIDALHEFSKKIDGFLGSAGNPEWNKPN